ncbi:MAG TPA: hypothetical protein VGO09_11630, partial [Flavisolibacter sp.]|nr:hypothetical protein [Flavisolibacter sp.]
MEFGLISLLFVKIHPRQKNVVIVAGSAFLLIFIITTIFLQPITSYQSITRVAAALLFISYTVVYYLYMMKELPVDNILYHMPFWLVTGI